MPLSPIWGAANWLLWGDEFFNHNGIGENLVQSLCPVCSKLYKPLFHQFISYENITKKILEEYVNKLLNYESKSYGFSVTIGNAISSIYTAKRIKEERPDSIIIFGGPETYLSYRATLFLQLPFIDLIIYHSEGEIPLYQILSELKDNMNIHNSPGIGFLHNKEVKFTNTPNKLDINKLPIPRYELLEDLNFKEIKSLDILTTKGCTNRCFFCNEDSVWGNFRRKNPQNIVKEIEYYIKNYGIYNFELVDNAFNLSEGIEKAVELLYNSDIKINWGGNCELSHINEKQMLNYSKKGLNHCLFGLESASPKILNYMRKKVYLNKFSKMLRLLSSINIKNFLYLMLGFPNETEDDFQKTIYFLRENAEFIENIVVSVFTLMKGSPIFNSNLLKPISLGPKELNAWTYETFDGILHKERMKRFLYIKNFWKNF